MAMQFAPFARSARIKNERLQGWSQVKPWASLCVQQGSHICLTVSKDSEIFRILLVEMLTVSAHAVVARACCQGQQLHCMEW